jgi:acetyl-CoA synthetase
MSNIGSYEEKYKTFDWEISAEELEYGKNGMYNIGYYCSDRICDKGFGKKIALIWQGFKGETKTFTYDDIRIYSNVFAKFLKDNGLQDGDRVCIFMDRIPELYISFLGILKMGSIAQPLFSAFGDEALFTRLDDAKTKAILTTKKHVRKIRRIREKLPELTKVIVVDADDKSLKDDEIAISMENAPKVEQFDVFKAGKETPSVLHYTSGTTGKPKGAMHVHSSIISQYITAKWVLDIMPDDIYWCTADPGWVTGTSYGIIGPWANGVTQVVFGKPFYDSYWQTETGSIVITNYPGMKVKPGSMGKAFPGIKATIVDPKNFEPITKPGTVGLIALKPGWPAMFRTYWANKELYDDKFKNGWYICGDRSSIDDDGYFWFVGRDDDVINTGGHLVGPFEIESALLEHEAVAESAAIGKPDPVNMEVVKAFIALKPGYEPSADLELSIMNFIRKKLSPLAMPQEIEFVKSLPKTRSGKIMRRLLHAKEWGEEIGDTSTLEDD